MSQTVVRQVSLHRFPNMVAEQSASAVGDPHVTSVTSEKFDLCKTGRSSFMPISEDEQILDVLVPEMVEQLVKQPKTVSVDRIQERTAEQAVDILVPQDVEKPAEFFKASFLDGVQQSSVEQTVETPDITLAEKIVKLPVIQTEGTTQRGANTHDQHVVNAVEVERPKIIDETVQKLIIQEKINQVIRVVDSEDLPLNVHRETQHQNEILRVTKMNLAKKYLEILAEIAELNDAYKKFYEQFVKCVKLGIHQNSVDGVEIAELLRFNTSKPGDEQISLMEYVDRMKEGQNDISYITGESIAVVSSSPFLENLRKNGYEAHYVVDPVDERTVQQVQELDGKC